MRSTLKFCNRFQMDLITWFYPPKSWWREAFWDDFFWEVDISLRPSLFVGRGIIMLNRSMLKSTCLWEHCAVQNVSWFKCMVVQAKRKWVYFDQFLKVIDWLPEIYIIHVICLCNPSIRIKCHCKNLQSLKILLEVTKAETAVNVFI